MTGRARIRLLLVDDHPVVREGLRSCLARHRQFVIVGEAGDGRTAVAQAKALRPDIVLMDIGLPGLNGLATARILHRQAPNAKVLVLTMHRSRECARQIIRAGAMGYVLKDAGPDELVRALESVRRGDRFFSAEVLPFMLRAYAEESSPTPSRPPALSAREREVLVLLVNGHSNKEIARCLKIGVRTVETHRERLMGKLDIHSVAGLTKFAVAEGLLNVV